MKYVQGLLAEIEGGSTYDDIIWNWWLTVQTNVKLLTVFDSYGIIDESKNILVVQEGEIYDFALCAVLPRVANNDEQPCSNDYYQATVVDVHKRIQKTEFQHFGRRSAVSGLILLSSSIGHLFVEQIDIEQEMGRLPDTGESIRLKCMRYDLLGMNPSKR